MNQFHPFVSKRANECCEYCKTPERTFGFPFEVDHFVPISRGGTDELDNLVLACRSCNTFKAFHQSGITSDSIGVRLFNPRTDVWDDHFGFDVENGEVIGLSEIGIGTINRLRINSRFQIRARRFWISSIEM
jgi:hypothetical protein